MQEIKCPKCGAIIQVDKSDYQNIVAQVRDEQFEVEIEKRMTQINKQKQTEYDLALEKIKNQTKRENDDAKILINNLKNEINDLKKNQDLLIKQAENKKELEIKEKDNVIAELKGNLKNKENEVTIKLKTTEDKYKDLLKEKEDELAQAKDYKAKLSVKLVGESLEQHCLTEFNRIRTAAFPRAYFEKDNEVVEGSKGDFVFKDYDEFGTEYISIMFEMKNESDISSTKHKNEDFFKRLDENRKKKGCEYAVLVSMLEPESELYNGITDVSYRYEKMYVIRPQFFLALITLLSNASKKTAQYKYQLEAVKKENIELTTFENNLNDWRDQFKRNVDIAGNHFNKAVEEIDKTIKHLQAVRDSLLSSTKQLEIANNKVQDMTIKKLTKDSPSIYAKIHDAHKE